MKSGVVTLTGEGVLLEFSVERRENGDNKSTAMSRQTHTVISPFQHVWSTFINLKNRRSGFYYMSKLWFFQ